MASESRLLVGSDRPLSANLAQLPNWLRLTKRNRLFWIVLVLILCWLPAVAYLAAEKSHGNHFGSPPHATEAKTPKP